MEYISYSMNTINETVVDAIIDIPKLYNIRKILQYCIDHSFIEALNTTIDLYNSGYSANDILLTFLKYIENYKNYDEFLNNSINQLALYKVISEYYMKVNNSIDSILQLCGCVSSMYILFN